MKGIFDIEEILKAKDIHSHQHYVEVAHRFEQRDIGYKHCRMLSALLFDVVEAGNQQRNCIEQKILRVETSATTNRMISRAPGKNSICSVRGSLITRRFCIY